MGLFSKIGSGIKNLGKWSANSYRDLYDGALGMFGIETGRAKDKRHKEQDRATQKQLDAQKELYEYTFGIQQRAKEDWAQKYETPSAQVENMEKAGLNPAMLYGGGNMGITGGGTAQTGTTGSISRGDDKTTEYMAQKQQMFNNMLNSKLVQSQVTKNKADAENANADTAKKLAETKTTDESRQYIVEGIKQQGIETWLRNNEKDFLQNYGVITDQQEQEMNSTQYINYVFGKNQRIEYNSLWTQTAVEGLLNIVADNGQKYSQEQLNWANEILASEKAQGVMYDLLTGRINASTAAEKMAYDTGKTWNTKQVMEMGTLLIGTALGGITKVGTMRNVAKSLNNKGNE